MSDNTEKNKQEAQTHPAGLDTFEPVWIWKKTDRTESTHAGVPTDRPERYGKQLVNHLGRRGGGEWSAEDGSGWIALGKGRATVTAVAGMLELTITAPHKQLPNLEKVVGSHLERFGERDALQVAWTRAG